MITKDYTATGIVWKSLVTKTTPMAFAMGRSSLCDSRPWFSLDAASYNACGLLESTLLWNVLTQDLSQCIA